MTAEKENVIITGCNGLIGSASTNRLAGKYRIIGFDIEESAQFPEDGVFHKVDLTSDSSAEEGMAKVRQEAGEDIRSVIHLAACHDPANLTRNIAKNG